MKKINWVAHFPQKGLSKKASLNVKKNMEDGPLTVVIKPSKEVACPAHDFKINAIGSKPGGEYTWKAEDSDAYFVDGQGERTDKGKEIWLRMFKKDIVNGELPEQKLNVVVEYSFFDQSASKSLTVIYHSIKFAVENEVLRGEILTKEFKGSEVTSGGNKIIRDAISIGGQNENENDIIRVKSELKVIIGERCPRKQACKTAYNAGNFQSVMRDKSYATYSKNSYRTNQRPNGESFPFQDGSDNGGYEKGKSNPSWYRSSVELDHTQDPTIVDFFDSPEFSFPLKIGNEYVKGAVWSLVFHTWLAVQQKEWSYHSGFENAILFLQNFEWSLYVRETINISRPPGQRVSIDVSNLYISAINQGMGPMSPHFKKRVIQDPKIIDDIRLETKN